MKIIRVDFLKHIQITGFGMRGSAGPDDKPTIGQVEGMRGVLLERHMLFVPSANIAAIYYERPAAPPAPAKK